MQNIENSYFPKDQCIHELFEAQVERIPDAVAVVFEGVQLTYHELNQRANQLAHYLRRLGVGPEVLVGMRVDRSVEMIVGILGILKAGGAYVPLDTAYPRERIVFMLEDCHPPILLTHQRLIEELPTSEVRVVCLDSEWNLIDRESKENLISEARADNLIYVIYTSGSTGKPKGVLVTHYNVDRLFKSTQPRFHFNENDVWSLFHSYAFDFSVWEMWGALLYGGRLVVVPYDISRSPEAFYDLLYRTHVTVLNQTPSAFYQLMQVEYSCGMAHELALRLVIFGGETLSLQSLRLWFERYGDTCPQFVNMYGITETTVHVTYRPLSMADLDNLDSTAGSLIGSPLPDLQVYILDQYCQQVPIGAPGEIYVGGAGVARGYLNRDALTAERFIPDPFNPGTEARLYRSGDLARYLHNGDLEYLGRIDHQVQLRGFRVELGEIEANINEHPAVRETVVLVREDASGDKRLVAYVVPDLNDQVTAGQITEKRKEQIAIWQDIFQNVYDERSSSPHDPTFNIAGWKSSYTGEPIPTEQMQEWVADTIAQIMAMHPNRVLEIGCGTGLILFRIAPHCSVYWGTDFSRAVLDSVQQHLSQLELSYVKLLHRMADNFDGIDSSSFDTVILNSLVQYFPDLDYLFQVLKGVVRSMRPDGRIFIGDIRSLPLLEAFHASVQLARAPASLSKAELRQQVYHYMSRDKELVIDPAFFIALKKRFPIISDVQITLKRGRYHNELTCFRYNVVLYIQAGQDSHISDPIWLDWHADELSLSTIRQYLIENQPDILGVRRVPNDRVWIAVKTLEWLYGTDRPETAGEMRAALVNNPTKSTIDPESIWALGDELSYPATISWSDSDTTGDYDVLFAKAHSKILGEEFSRNTIGSLMPISRQTHHHPWSAYANDLTQTRLSEKLAPDLRHFLKNKLPDYMIPSAFVILKTFPLTPNGKIDRRALPVPDTARPELAETYIEPSSSIEKELTRIWSTILGIDRVGIYDNFFELGGHSLLAAQIIARVNKLFRLNLLLRSLFDAPTVNSLAKHIEAICWVTQSLLPSAREKMGGRKEIVL